MIVGVGIIIGVGVGVGSDFVAYRLLDGAAFRILFALCAARPLYRLSPFALVVLSARRDLWVDAPLHFCRRDPKFLTYLTYFFVRISQGWISCSLGAVRVANGTEEIESNRFPRLHALRAFHRGYLAV